MSERLVKRIPDPFYRVRLLKAVRAEARRAALDPQLVLAVIDIESDFNRHALSHAGAQGLMQVMPFWKEVQGISDDDLYNPLVSLRYGCTILRHYLDKHENPSDALVAYNGSLGRSIYSDKVESPLKKHCQFQADTFSKEEPKLAAR
ncbi:MAG: soluble lytic murein transglycosylase-like protein [Arenicella sp.]|jgi:soluble lytic murein transglycosylase-like protein